MRRSSHYTIVDTTGEYFSVQSDHSRLCGLLICQKCSRYRASVYGDSKQSMRVCIRDIGSPSVASDQNDAMLLGDVELIASYKEDDPPTVRKIRKPS